jgi:hypothetical protein
VAAGFMALPYSMYLGFQARAHPTKRMYYLKRMFWLPTLGVTAALGSGYFMEKHIEKLSDKYFSHLSDADLDNFEEYYNMKK